MVVRTVIALGVGLLAVTTLAAEPLRFVTEPESTALPVPVEAAAEPAAQPLATDNGVPVASRPASNRRMQVDRPSPSTVDDGDATAQASPSDADGTELPYVTHSTGKAKVVTIVRPRKFATGTAAPRAMANQPVKPIEEPAPLPMASNSASQPRHLVPSGRVTRPQGAPLASGNSAAQSRPTPARKAARIAVSSDEQSGRVLPKPVRAKTRHLLPSSNAAAELAASDVDAKTPADLPADKPTARRRVPAAVAQQREPTPLAFAPRQPALLADDPSPEPQTVAVSPESAPPEFEPSKAAPLAAAPAEAQSSQPVEAFRFRLSEEGATATSQTASADEGSRLDTGSTAGQSLEFHTAQIPSANPVRAEAKPLEVASEPEPAAVHQVPLALRLDALHSKPAKRAAKAKPTEIASLESRDTDRAAARSIDAPSKAPHAQPEPTMIETSKQNAAPAEVAESASAGQSATAQSVASQGAAAPAKGSVVHFDRAQQTVRLIFSGSHLPPVGSIIRVQHTSVFGGNEVTTLRVVRVESGEVLARATGNVRLQRLSRGDLAFYRPLNAVESNARDTNVARAPVTARETVWK